MNFFSAFYFIKSLVLLCRTTINCRATTSFIIKENTESIFQLPEPTNDVFIHLCSSFAGLTRLGFN